jgi:phosphoribosylglycinamide formyltransferase-1
LEQGSQKKIRLAIFASGNGSNAIRIYDYFLNHPHIQVSKIFTNNPNAGLIQKFENKNIYPILFNAAEFRNETFLSKVKDIEIIILAGFLLLVPKYIIENFDKKIINIHPSLLPKYGGKGMYGDHVHRAVLAHHEDRSGITIHLVNDEYDKGEILAQYECRLSAEDKIEDLKKKIQALEQAFFPLVIDEYISKIYL